MLGEHRRNQHRGNRGLVNKTHIPEGVRRGLADRSLPIIHSPCPLHPPWIAGLPIDL